MLLWLTGVKNPLLSLYSFSEAGAMDALVLSPRKENDIQ
jgi:hypothetical protein